MRKAPLVFISVLIIASAGFAQMPVDGARYDAVPKISHPLPFKVGETLSFEISFSKLIFSGDIADMKLTVSKAANDMLEIKADLQSKGFYPKLFGVKVKNQFSALVDSTDLGLHASRKKIEEGKVRREMTSIVNRDAHRVTYTDRDLVNTKAAPEVRETDAPAWVHDILSALYFVRTQKLEEGGVIPIPLTDYGQVYNIEIIVGKREEVKVDAGKFNTIMLDAKIFDGRYLRRSGQMLIWVTDDARRIPVRAKIKTPEANLTINLKRIS
ncbi:MAG TPA: DUF3108 domain-containing protein [Blastocatellia bacterium]|nr:DUF3108 domain-containing protein [Blastocatellia bacterium]